MVRSMDFIQSVMEATEEFEEAARLQFTSY